MTGRFYVLVACIALASFVGAFLANVAFIWWQNRRLGDLGE